MCREAQSGACVMHKEESVGGVRETTESRAHGTSIEARGARTRISTKTETRGQTGSDQCSVGTNGCAECDSSNTACTRCDPDDSSNKRYLKDGVCVTAEECTGSNDHYIDSSDTSSLVCRPCSTIAGCSTCSSGTVCTKCTGDNYLKTVSGVTTCVTDCGEGYFKHTAATGDLKTCQSCSGANAGLNPAAVGISGCAACTYASDKVTCTKCETGKYLKTTSDSTSCVEASGCGSGFFPKADDKAGNKYMPCGEAGSGGIADCQTCSLFPYK